VIHERGRKLAGLAGGRRRRAEAAREGALPVRIGGSEYARTTSTPSRVLGFDQALIWVRGAAGLRPGDGVFGLIALPDNPRFARYRPTLPGAPHHVDRAVAGGGAAGVPGAMDWWEKMARRCSWSRWCC
jgi:cell division protein FtsW